MEKMEILGESYKVKEAIEASKMEAEKKEKEPVAAKKK